MPYHEEEARRLVIQAGLLLTEKKLIARTWGNISARICDTQFVITPSGRAYDTLKPEDLVKVNIADGSYTASNKPSSECGVHLAAYQLRRDISFVIHTHQFYASAVCAAYIIFLIGYTFSNECVKRHQLSVCIYIKTKLIFICIF